MIIDRPGMPETRLDSISSVQYQIALALVAPDRLLDVRRTPPFANNRLQKLMTKVRVRSAPELEKYYPATWPARVVIHAGGRRISHELLNPRGDARNRFSWDDAIGKFRTTVGPLLGPKTAERVARQVRYLDAAAEMPPLWKLSARERR
jgi:2-methylcitrate dehydratase PrpD